MPIDTEGSAPYAPTHAVVKVLNSYRDSLPSEAPVTLNTLTRLGVTESIQARTLQALKTLDLVADDGTPKPDFVAFKRAPHDKYLEVFAQVLRRAYAPVFEITGSDLAQKSREQIHDAFRTYKPETLQDRMVNLFMGLCGYAGLIEEAPTRKPARPGRRAPRTLAVTAMARSAAVPRVSATPVGMQPERSTPKSDHGDTTTLELRSGGSVTLTLRVNLLNLDSRDRKFVLDLVDKVKEYQKHPALSPGLSIPMGQVDTEMFNQIFDAVGGKSSAGGDRVHTDAESRVQTEAPPEGSGEGPS
jgi:hypothetical protein